MNTGFMPRVVGVGFRMKTADRLTLPRTEPEPSLEQYVNQRRNKGTARAAVAAIPWRARYANAGPSAYLLLTSPSVSDLTIRLVRCRQKRGGRRTGRVNKNCFLAFLALPPYALKIILDVRLKHCGALRLGDLV